ncbi:MAG: hypothetical protein ACI9MR_000820 [Myxococcota bacterium]|jgi:hypothetical protein
MLVYRRLPRLTDVDGWVGAFEEHFEQMPEVRHVALCWDVDHRHDDLFAQTAVESVVAAYVAAGFEPVDITSFVTPLPTAPDQAAANVPALVVRPLGAGPEQVDHLGGGSTMLSTSPNPWKTPGLPACPPSRPARRLLAKIINLFWSSPLVSEADWAAQYVLECTGKPDALSTPVFEAFVGRMAKRLQRWTDEGRGQFYGAFDAGVLVAVLGIYLDAKTGLARYQRVLTRASGTPTGNLWTAGRRGSCPVQSTL